MILKIFHDAYQKKKKIHDFSIKKNYCAYPRHIILIKMNSFKYFLERKKNKNKNLLRYGHKSKCIHYKIQTNFSMVSFF